MTSHIPNLSWYQSDSHIFCEILIRDLKNVIVDFETNEGSVFLMEGDADKKHYSICFQLYDLIVDELSTFRVMDSCVKVMMKKKKDDEEWPQLQKNKDLYKNAIRVNWDKMDFEEEEMHGDYEQMMQQMKMQQMMQGMGGMNFMNPPSHQDDEEGEEGEEEGEEGEEEGEEVERTEEEKMKMMEEMMEMMKEMKNENPEEYGEWIQSMKEEESQNVEEEE
jgi:hypothetical protein